VVVRAGTVDDYLLKPFDCGEPLRGHAAPRGEPARDQAAALVAKSRRSAPSIAASDTGLVT
jgi:hypothetical protein